MRTKEEYLAEVTNAAHCFTCEQCGVPSHRRMGGNSTKNRFCSQACRIQYFVEYRLANADQIQERIRLRTDDKKAKDKAARAQRSAEKAALKRAFVPPPKPISMCIDGCGEQSKRAGLRCLSCSAAHTQRMRKAQKVKYKVLRRVRETISAESIDPIRVFDMNKWRCQDCGIKTPKRLRGTNDPNAPELDHIITLADKGGHTWGNVRCLCRRCNGIKGARSLGQLGLGFR